MNIAFSHQTLPQRLHHFTLPIAMCQSSNFSTSSPIFFSVLLSNGHPNVDKVVSFLLSGSPVQRDLPMYQVRPCPGRGFLTLIKKEFMSRIIMQRLVLIKKCTHSRKECRHPGEQPSSLVKQSTHSRRKYRHCLEMNSTPGVQVGWSYSWSISRGWNIHLDRWGFLGIGRGFLGKQGDTLFLSLDGLPQNCPGPKRHDFQYANKPIMYFEVKPGSTSPYWKQSVLADLLSIPSLPTSHRIVSRNVEHLNKCLTKCKHQPKSPAPPCSFLATYLLKHSE